MLACEPVRTPARTPARTCTSCTLASIGVSRAAPPVSRGGHAERRARAGGPPARPPLPRKNQGAALTPREPCPDLSLGTAPRPRPASATLGCLPAGGGGGPSAAGPCTLHARAACPGLLLHALPRPLLLGVHAGTHASACARAPLPALHQHPSTHARIYPGERPPAPWAWFPLSFVPEHSPGSKCCSRSPPTLLRCVNIAPHIHRRQARGAGPLRSRAWPPRLVSSAGWAAAPDAAPSGGEQARRAP